MNSQPAMDMQTLIAEARRQRTEALPEASRDAVARHRAVFDRAAIRVPRSGGINVFVFHVPVPAEASRISYNDIRMDHGAFDYDRIVEHFLMTALSHDPDCFVYLVTSEAFAARFAHPRLAGVVLDLDPVAPMYERVRAMAAYAHSAAFDANTAFLDGDAFVNRSLRPVFECPFDVGVTYRGDPGLMPINEGVIFAQAARREKVQAFFDGYLATYDRLIAHPPVVAHYGDIRRWRGGQLSLNAMSCPEGVPSEIDSTTVFGAQIRYFPCLAFNYSMEAGHKYKAAELDGKYVLHLKGPRKQFLEVIAKYQQSRLKHQERVRSSLAPAAPAEAAPQPVPAPPQAAPHTNNPKIPDRAYSLDSTPPTDYEPPVPIDYARASLTEIADQFKTDKGSIKHNYAKVYERYFAPLRGKSMRLMEFGVACGSSLKMWSMYFPNAKVTGVDLREDCKTLCKRYPSIDIRICHPGQVRQPETFDIIIDDASHVSADIVDMFKMNWPSLRPGGFYVIEDLKCTHNPDYPRQISFDVPKERFERRHFMDFIDQELRQLDWSKSEIDYIHFYREMAVIRKQGPDLAA